MEINDKTQYSLGDEVWVVSNGKVTKGTIVYARYTIAQGNSSSQTPRYKEFNREEVYYVSTKYVFNSICHPGDIYKSAEAALATLID